LLLDRAVCRLDKRREKAKGSPGNQYTGPVPARNQSIPPTLRDLGVSKRQAHDLAQAR